MLVALKLVAITDRPRDRRKKDGTDIAFVVEHYLATGQRERLKTGPGSGFMHRSGNDLDVASAMLLGMDMAGSMQIKTRRVIGGILRHEAESQSRCELVHGMMAGKRYHTFPRAREIVKGMLEGFHAL